MLHAFGTCVDVSNEMMNCVLRPIFDKLKPATIGLRMLLLGYIKHISMYIFDAERLLSSLPFFTRRVLDFGPFNSSVLLVNSSDFPSAPISVPA